ncbi:MAG: hypothetical protein P4L10_01350 [Acidobacteriaceae bacterium]|nr:hypothetical protein [Acidobacteriaceae bacterium]
MSTTKKKPLVGKSKVKTVKAKATSNRVLLRATLDSAGSMRLLKALGHKLQLKRSPTIAQLLSTIKGNKKLLAEFSAFYRDRWPKLAPRKIDTGQLLSLPQEADDTLKSLSWEIFAEGNKSETLRVLIHFFAAQHKLPLTVDE